MTYKIGTVEERCVMNEGQMLERAKELFEHILYSGSGQYTILTDEEIDMVKEWLEDYDGD